MKAFLNTVGLKHDRSLNPNLILHHLRFLLGMKVFKHIIFGFPVSFETHDASCLSLGFLENGA